MSTILAGGAVVARRHPTRGLEVLLVHRPGYLDWTLPKGKTKHMESLPGTAVREVAEETGVSIRLGAPLDRLTYATKLGPKQVDYWAGVVTAERPRVPDDEVDEVVWVSTAVALQRLTYAHDQFILEQYLAQPATVPLIVLRHAKAMDRRDWSKTDVHRPIAARGRVEAKRVVDLLAAYGIDRVVSSPANRCVSTVSPYASCRSVQVTTRKGLTEEHGSDDAKGVAKIMAKLRRETLDSGTPTVVCGHRPVLPHMFAALHLPAFGLRPAEAVVVHLRSDGEPHAVERHRVPH